MRYGGWETCYKRCNRAFPVWGIFSWRAEKLLASRSPRPESFRDSSSRLWETFIFLLFPRIINVIKGKVGESISTIIIIAPLVAIMKPSSSEFGITTTTAIRLGTGGRHGRRHGLMWKEGVRVRYLWKPRKAKKNYVVYWCWVRARDECTPS